MRDENRRWWVLTGVSIVSFLGCLDLTIVNTAAPALGRDLGLSLTALQVVVNVVVVALAMFMVTAGRIGDLFGRRTALYAGTVLFGVASAGAALSISAPWLVGWRFLQGVACALLYTSSSTIVAAAFPPARRGRAIGTLFAVNGLGLAAGPLLGGLIVTALGWPWIFWINVPLAGLALAICLPTVAASPPAEEPVRLDWPGLVLLAAGLCGTLFGLTFHDTFGWGSPAVLAPLLGGLAALAAFVLVERRVAAPIVPFALLGRPLFLAAVSADFGLAFFYTTALFVTPLYLSLARGLDPLAVGLWMLPMTVTVAVLSPLLGRVVDVLGPVPVLVAGFVAFTVSAILQAGLEPASGPAAMLPAFALMGVGWACVLGPAAVAALSSVPERLGGLAVGAGWTFHNVGGALGLALGLTLYRAASGESVVAGHRAAMLMLVAGAALTGLVVAVVGRSSLVDGVRALRDLSPAGAGRRRAG